MLMGQACPGDTNWPVETTQGFQAVAYRYLRGVSEPHAATAIYTLVSACSYQRLRVTKNGSTCVIGGNYLGPRAAGLT